MSRHYSEDLEARFRKLIQNNPTAWSWYTHGTPGDYKQLAVLLGEQIERTTKKLAQEAVDLRSQNDRDEAWLAEARQHLQKIRSGMQKGVEG